MTLGSEWGETQWTYSKLSSNGFIICGRKNSKMPPPKCPVLISRNVIIIDSVTFHGKRDFAGVVKVAPQSTLS